MYTISLVPTAYRAHPRSNSAGPSGPFASKATERSHYIFLHAYSSMCDYVIKHERMYMCLIP